MIELLTNAEMARADQLAIASGIAGIDLMENAGRAVADVAAKRFPPGTGATIVAGIGNNGGDGFIAARLLSERGYRVRMLLVGNLDQLKGDAAIAARRFQGITEPANPAALTPGDGIIDALFGAGLDRPAEGAARAMIDAMNRSGAPIIAVDLPSGIQGTTGAVMGEAAKAAHTVTFFRRKPGHLLLPGRLQCGHVSVADIGIPAAVLSQIKPKTFINTPKLWGGSFPVPRPEGHKYSRGHAVVLSGGLAKTGAARLAARAALRAGAGLVSIASPLDAVAVNAAASLAVMVRPIDGAGDLSKLLEDPRFNAVALGPGGGVGARMRELVGVALEGSRAVVLDADALTSFEDDLSALRRLIEVHRPHPVVLTPHAGEFMRLFKKIRKATDKEDKLQMALAASVFIGATIILKGADTVVAEPDGRAVIADNAPPWLATAGSGDVLTGIVTGLLAQGMPAFEAAAAAVWLHGEAGHRGGIGLIAEDLPELLPPVYRTLLAELPP